MIIGYFISILFSIITIIINDPIERSYITLILAFTLCLGYFLRALPYFTSRHRKLLFILKYIHIIFILSFANEWNETIIFILTIEIFILV